MNILFCKGSSILSKAICWVTAEPVSHCALEFPDLGIVVHSNLLGVGLEWSSYFRKNTTVLAQFTIPTTLAEDRAKLGVSLDKWEGSWYDVGALLFTGFALLAHRYLKTPLPKKNLWQTSGAFLCTEWVTKYIIGKEDSLITPYQLYLTLKGAK